MNNVILVKIKELNKFVKLVNEDLNTYKQNLKVFEQAQLKGKCEIIYAETNSYLTQNELIEIQKQRGGI